VAENKLENAVFITGGGQRIGAYLVRQFLLETDYPVIFTYRTHHPEVDQLVGLGAQAIQVDLMSAGAIQALVDSVFTHASSLRAVVHNASVWLNDEEAPALSDEYRSLFGLHVDGPICLNEALKSLLNASSSSLKDIISLSDFGVANPNSQTIAYLASKAALQNAMQNFAKKFAPEIKVNDIAPGLILFNEGDSEEYKAKRLAQSAIPIEPGAGVVWQAVQYLMNSPYTTGISLPLNGGNHLV